MDEKTLPSLILFDEAAKLLSISPRHLRRLVDAGHAPMPIRLGRSVRFRRDDIIDWLKRGCPSDRTTLNEPASKNCLAVKRGRHDER